MKLYTEEQVKKMIEKSQYTGLTADFLILAAPSVQLPTYEEIEKESFDLYANHNTYSLNVRQYKAFKKGAKWMRDKIQEQ